MVILVSQLMLVENCTRFYTVCSWYGLEDQFTRMKIRILYVTINYFLPK